MISKARSFTLSLVNILHTSSFITLHYTSYPSATSRVLVRDTMPFKSHHNSTPSNRMTKLSETSSDSTPAPSPTQPQPQAGPSRKRKLGTTTETRRTSTSVNLKSPRASQSASIGVPASPSPSPPPQTQFDTQDSGDLWEAITILDERGESGSGHYLIQWAGEDPDTGEAWEPTWERRKNVTPALAAEWKQKKRNDPSIIGVEGKRLADIKKAIKEAAKKRRREEKEAQKKKKPRKGSQR